MRVLIAGATGFVGRALTHALVERGDRRVALTRDPARARMALPGLAHAHPWDPAAGPPPAEAFEGVDAVVNLMGESVVGRWTPQKKRAILESREDAARNLVRGMQQAASAGAVPRVLVSASAVGYYGHRDEEELTEDALPGDGFLSGVCVRWEAAALEAAGARGARGGEAPHANAPPSEAPHATAPSGEALRADAGARVVLLRTGLVAGRGGGFLAPLSRLTRFGLGGPAGSGQQWWPWVHLDDVVGLILHALDNEAVHGPLNVCAPAPARQREVASALGRVLRRPALAPAPAFALRLALGEFATELLNSRRTLPAAALASGYAFRHTDLDAALRDICE